MDSQNGNEKYISGTRALIRFMLIRGIPAIILFLIKYLMEKK